MQCPKCNTKDTRVIDSRIAKSGLAIRRRRQCAECDHRFTTTEEIVREDLFVIKSDGRREEFDRSKIVNGIRRACEKRPIEHDQIEIIVSDILVAIENEFDSELPTRVIGEHVMNRLKKIDKIAYVRFASVYKDFHDLEDLSREISELKMESDV
ncbi:MAG: transcriptional regulator NrdR [Verrucomicrobia bacterium]|nr:transcriptional regulator NrdR [Verrucomicrobiota bacterium]